MGKIFDALEKSKKKPDASAVKTIALVLLSVNSMKTKRYP